MPWYKLPHSNLVMWFDQKMPNLKPGKKPAPKRVKPATGGVFKGPGPKIGYPAGVIDEVVIPNAPKPAPKDESGAE